MRISHRRLREILVDRLTALLVLPLKRDRHARSRRKLKIAFLVGNNIGFILSRIDLHLIIVSRLVRFGARYYFNRLTCRDQSVHASRTNTDTLLTPAHLKAVKLTAVKQTRKNIRNLIFQNPRPVISNVKSKLAIGIRNLFDRYGNVRKDMSIFASVKRIIHRFFNRCQKRLTRVVKAKQMTVLGKKFADTDIPLFRRHSFSSCSNAFFAFSFFNRAFGFCNFHLFRLSNFCFFGHGDFCLLWIGNFRGFLRFCLFRLFRLSTLYLWPLIETKAHLFTTRFFLLSCHKS